MYEKKTIESIDELEDEEFMEKLCTYLNKTNSNKYQIGTVLDIIDDLYEYTNTSKEFLSYFERVYDIKNIIRIYLDNRYNKKRFCCISDNHLKLLYSDDIIQLRRTYTDILDQYFYNS